MKTELYKTKTKCGKCKTNMINIEYTHSKTIIEKIIGLPQTKYDEYYCPQCIDGPY